MLKACRTRDKLIDRTATMVTWAPLGAIIELAELGFLDLELPG